MGDGDEKYTDTSGNKQRTGEKGDSNWWPLSGKWEVRLPTTVATLAGK